MNGSHGDRYDTGGKHRGERKPFAIQVALKRVLDRISGPSPHKDWSGHPLDDEPSTAAPRRCCGTSFYNGHLGTCHLSVMSTGVFIAGDEWPERCPGCDGPAESGERWCQDCVDNANPQFIGEPQ